MLRHAGDRARRVRRSAARARRAAGQGGRYSEAIDAFKAAERIEPRALHACLIALAYTRRELWPQAEIFLDQCEKRATAADPLPEWVPTAKQQLAERLAAVNVAAVEIVVEPAGVDVKLAVSSFAPDELFEPRTIHLPPGRHVITVTAHGLQRRAEDRRGQGQTPQNVSITMLPIDDTSRRGGRARRSPRHAATAPTSKVPVVVMGVGGALVRRRRRDSRDAVPHRARRHGGRAAKEQTARVQTRPTDRFDRYRAAVDRRSTPSGAVTLGTGVVLALTEHESKEPRRRSRCRRSTTAAGW